MRYFLGMDCGASSTRALIVSESGSVLGWARAGPVRHLYDMAGMDQLESVFGNVVRLLVGTSGQQLESVDSACVGIAVGGSPDSQHENEAIAACLRSVVDCRLIMVCEDSYVALIGATGGASGVVVSAGTGSVALAMNPQGKTAKCGGWGYILGDEGSGYAIGLSALRAVCQEADGTGESTQLTPRVFNCLGIEDVRGLLKVTYGSGIDRTLVASLCSHVAELAAAGDTVARRILRKAGQDLAGLATGVLTQLCLPRARVYYSGGVFRAGALVLDSFKDGLRANWPDVSITRSRLAPVVGATLLALKQAGVLIDRSTIRNLGRTCPLK